MVDPLLSIHPAQANPGMTAATISQSLETSWNHLKKCLDKKVVKMPATDALNAVLKVVEAQSGEAAQ